MRYEVIERTRGDERIVARTRRANGAEAELAIAVESAYRNALKHAEAEGRVAQGPDGKGGTAVVWYGDDFAITWTYTVRPVGGDRTPNPDLTDVLLASLIAVGGASI